MKFDINTRKEGDIMMKCYKSNLMKCYNPDNERLCNPHCIFTNSALTIVRIKWKHFNIVVCNGRYYCQSCNFCMVLSFRSHVLFRIMFWTFTIFRGIDVLLFLLGLVVNAGGWGSFSSFHLKSVWLIKRILVLGTEY